MVPQELAASRYVSLVTHRRDGTAVPTPVWAAADGPELLVWTRTDSGKVRRLRRDTQVAVAPCDVRGRTGDAEPAQGEARLLEPEQLSRVRDALRRKYGWQFRLLDAGQALLRRGRQVHTGIAVTF
ncbi:PPOX class F420-dependent oxidoreductase [Streptomyces sulphureus]|uniref:PPOX class F420-dependent oxidoreductase n=1 Tax=Streptomyces sulphureus TaxID=47758 RepID=UPI00037C49BA|nr:PPOX class F420-dependent oxidoreductase [Streptomyces sulphureus]